MTRYVEYTIPSVNILLVKKILVSTDALLKQVHLFLKTSGHVSKIWLREFYIFN
jgi:hypothetical protein